MGYLLDLKPECASGIRNRPIKRIGFGRGHLTSVSVFEPPRVPLLSGSQHWTLFATFSLGVYQSISYLFRLRRPTRKTTTKTNTAIIIQGHQEPVVGSVTLGLLEDEVSNLGVTAGMGVGVGVDELD